MEGKRHGEQNGKIQHTPTRISTKRIERLWKRQHSQEDS